MPSEHGGVKNEFITRFLDSYNGWLDRETSMTKDAKDEEERLQTNSEVSKEHVTYGFNNEIKSLQHFLLDQKVYKEFKSLVIVGEYGVGKTELCRNIFNDEDVKSVYAPRIWVSMYSKDTKEGEDKKISVLKRILKGLGVKDSILESISEVAKQEAKDSQEAEEIDGETATEKEISALLYALHLNLRWKKYLIVFDDVRKEDNWDEKLDEKLKEGEKWGKYLSDGFPKGSGGRVIYTTRDETLAKKLVAEEHEIHRLWPLTDTQSVWKIYEAVVIKKGKDPPRNDKKCIDELMNKSRGLPLAAIRLAELDPVLLDDEVPADGSNHGTADSGNSQTANQTSS